MVKFLINKGVHVNERNECDGSTVLHEACDSKTRRSARFIHLLFKYGVDPNILDYFGKVPINYSKSYEVSKTIVIELAKMKFDDQWICSKNLKYLDSMECSLKKTFEDCLKELERMRDCKFYNNISLFFILSSHYRRTNTLLISLTKDKDLVMAFKSGWNRRSFKYYGKELDDIFKDALDANEKISST